MIWVEDANNSDWIQKLHKQRSQDINGEHQKDLSHQDDQPPLVKSFDEQITDIFTGEE